MVTCWEMMEHIAEPDIARVAENVKKHLAPTGLWIMSVSPRSDMHNGVELHQTIQPKSWWIAKFEQLGLDICPAFDRYFNTQFIRGPKYGTLDSFHLILSQDPSKAPPIPKGFSCGVLTTGGSVLCSRGSCRHAIEDPSRATGTRRSQAKRA